MSGPSAARRTLRILAQGGVLALVAFAARVLAPPAGRALIARTERRLNALTGAPRPVVPAEVAALHASLTIVDLHADALLWGRNLLVRGERGHVDLPRLAAGNVAVQVFGVATKSPRHLNIERNDDRTDDLVLVAIANGWPTRTWTRLLARAEHQAARLHRFAAESGGRLTVITTAADLRAHLERRASDPALIGGLLAIEGAHALDDDVANVERLAAAGYRMVGIAHFFDNAFGGSAHGLAKGGLTAAGRQLVAALEGASIAIDLAHASAATIDDVLAIATRPVVVSHSGVRGTADNARNLSDEQLRGIAATGGLIGIGFWPTASGGEDAASIAAAVRHAVDVVGADHVGLGSDWDGAVPTPFDAAGLADLTAALVAAGLDEATIAPVMGGSAVRFLERSLPPT